MIARRKICQLVTHLTTLIGIKICLIIIIEYNRILCVIVDDRHNVVADTVAPVSHAEPAAVTQTSADTRSVLPAPEQHSAPAPVQRIAVAAASDEDRQIMEQLQQLLSDQPLYLDPNLTLQQVARKAVIPGRQISAAVNRLTDGNFSQWINAYRIDAICQQLRHSELPITELMLVGGFQTKSNFNREFRRITGMSPSEYRQQAGVPPTC